MANSGRTRITVTAQVAASLDAVWEYWTEPRHITQWTFATPDWHAPHAENDLRPGGSFLTRMEAKDGSYGFDFSGIYEDVVPKSRIAYSLGDNRQITVTFSQEGETTTVTEAFDAEDVNSVEQQLQGWQAILNNFKAYAESHFERSH